MRCMKPSASAPAVASSSANGWVEWASCWCGRGMTSRACGVCCYDVWTWSGSQERPGEVWIMYL